MKVLAWTLAAVILLALIALAALSWVARPDGVTAGVTMSGAITCDGVIDRDAGVVSIYSIYDGRTVVEDHAEDGEYELELEPGLYNLVAYSGAHGGTPRIEVIEQHTVDWDRRFHDQFDFEVEPGVALRLECASSNTFEVAVSQEDEILFTDIVERGRDAVYRVVQRGTVRIYYRVIGPVEQTVERSKFFTATVGEPLEVVLDD